MSASHYRTHGATALAPVAAVRAVIYCRISLDKQGLDLGVDRQEEECRARCAQLGWTVVEVIVDNDLSAYKDVQRPGYDRVVRMLHAGEINGVMVTSLERFVRRNRQLEAILDDLPETDDYTIQSVQGGGYDLSNPTGRMMARTVGAVAQLEVEQKALRQQSKNRQLAKGGFWRGGPAPYGYRNARVALGGDRGATAGTLEIEESEAVLVREMVARAIDGWSLYAIQLDLEDRGLRTRRGSHWNRQGIRKLLMSGAIAGRVMTFPEQGHGDKDAQPGLDLGPGGWPAIVDHEEWLALQAILLDPSRRNRRSRNQYLLTGLVRVAGTDPVRRMYAHHKNGTRRYGTVGDGYYRGERGAYIDADGLEAFVIAALLAETDDRVIVDVSAEQKSNAAATRALRLLDEEEAELIAKRRAKAISPAMLLARAEHIEEQRETLRETVVVRAMVDRDLEPYLMEPGRLRPWWELPEGSPGALTFSQRRRVLRLCIRSVEISRKPGVNRFDPDRITILWN